MSLVWIILQYLLLGLVEPWTGIGIKNDIFDVEIFVNNSRLQWPKLLHVGEIVLVGVIFLDVLAKVLLAGLRLILRSIGSTNLLNFANLNLVLLHLLEAVPITANLCKGDAHVVELYTDIIMSFMYYDHIIRAFFTFFTRRVFELGSAWAKDRAYLTG